jgi:sugar lactone lactonase YvrE
MRKRMGMWGVIVGLAMLGLAVMAWAWWQGGGIRLGEPPQPQGVWTGGLPAASKSAPQSEQVVAQAGTQEGAQEDPPAASAALPIRALEVVGDKTSPSLAMPDAQGRLWVVQQHGGDRVSRRELDGRWTAVVGAGERAVGEHGNGGLAVDAARPSPDVQSPDSIALAPDGTLYVADTGHHVIRAVDPATLRMRRLAGDGSERTPQSLGSPESLLRTPDGALWFVAGRHRARKVYRLQPETGQLDVAYEPNEATPQWGGNRDSAYIADLAADAQGRIYVADNGNMRLLRLDAWRGAPINPRAPAATVLAGNGTADVLRTDVPATQSPLGFITSLAVSPDGQLYLYQEAVAGHLVRLDAATGRFVTVLPADAWVKPPGQQAQRLGLRQARLRVGPQGALYLADRLNNRVLVLTP